MWAFSWSARRSVHPRSRGEHLCSWLPDPPFPGSSPLARGTRIRHPLKGLHGRFIPARAGNTPDRASATPRPPVHPRSRGEHFDSARVSGTLVGSSPLARGTRNATRPSTPLHRFIPARAGNTPASIAWRRITAVHPRSRGEHLASRDPVHRQSGSSPLARGTPRSRHARAPRHRFIPARAGNTPHPRTSCCSATVHPRSRGEHFCWRNQMSHQSGSSPLARGTPDIPARRPRIRRFIPARAGNTTSHAALRPSATVHPRSRGEHGRIRRAISMNSGSSPLARGTRWTGNSKTGPLRFIPARAGNTPARGRAQHFFPVHPRSRGEHRTVSPLWPAFRGSSPLARGTRLE